MGKRIIIIAMLLAAMAARAFDFRVQAPSGQYVYYSIVGGNAVKVVNPDWDNYSQPSGMLTIPATVENNGTTYQVRSIDAEAFIYCTNLTGVIIPEGVTSIGRMAFFNCTSLDSIVLPSTLEVLGTQAFNTTAYLNNDSHWNNDMLIIGSYLVKTRATVSGELTVPEGILGVGNMAVYNCLQLEHATLPSTLLFIGEHAFSACTALDTVELRGNVPPSLEVNSFLDVPSFIVAVPCSTAAVYQEAPNWSSLTIVELCGGGQEPIIGITDVDPQPSFVVTAVEGGLQVMLPEGHFCTVNDLMGRYIATLNRDSFVSLKNRGVYFVSDPSLGKTLKVVYTR